MPTYGIKCKPGGLLVARKQAAKELDVKVTLLDDLVSKARDHFNKQKDDAQASAADPDIAKINTTHALVLAGNKTMVMKFEDATRFRLLHCSDCGFAVAPIANAHDRRKTAYRERENGFLERRAVEFESVLDAGSERGREQMFSGVGAQMWSLSSHDADPRSRSLSDVGWHLIDFGRVGSLAAKVARSARI